MTCLPSMVALCATLTGSPSVVDGDTLRFGALSVRLQGIDAEERREPHGHLATQALRHIVAGTAYVRCVPDGSSTHSRVVAVCYTAKGEDIGALMVAQGYALDCARYSKGRYRPLEPQGVRLRLMQKAYCEPASSRR